MTSGYCAGCGKTFEPLQAIVMRSNLSYHLPCKPEDPPKKNETPANVISIGRKLAKFVAFAICLICQRRWIAAVNFNTPIFKLECPSCKSRESFASIVPSEYLKESI